MPSCALRLPPAPGAPRVLPCVCAPKTRWHPQVDNVAAADAAAFAAIHPSVPFWQDLETNFNSLSIVGQQLPGRCAALAPRAAARPAGSSSRLARSARGGHPHAGCCPCATPAQ
jgi:hypothetical protein